MKKIDEEARSLVMLSRMDDFLTRGIDESRSKLERAVGACDLASALQELGRLHANRELQTKVNVELRKFQQGES